jgi:hypothetical protein
MTKTTKIWLRQAIRFIQLGLVSLVMIAAICFALMITGADAQNHYNHMGWNNGIAYVAEKEIREAEILKAEQKANTINAKSGTHVAAPAGVAAEYNEEEHSSDCPTEMVKENTKC